MKLRHYYHIYVDGDWEDIVDDHFEALWNSGLMVNLDVLKIGLVGSEENREKAITLINTFAGPMPWSIAALKDSGYEQETQDVLYHDAEVADEPFLALYAHSKGSSDRSAINEVWRKAMTRYCVYKWLKPTTILRYSDRVAAGCFWAPFNNGRDLNIEEGTQYFAGTFWWAKSETIKQLGPPGRESRFGAEAWMGKAVTVLNQPIHNLLDVPLTVEALMAYSY